MSKDQHLKQYRKNVVELTKQAKDLGLSNTQVETIFKESFLELRKTSNGSTKSIKQKRAQKICSIFKKIFVLFILISLFMYILLNVHQPTSSIVLRNVQGLTYPTLKFVRFLSVPIIKLFPSLTDLYDETCLVENPYFYVADMECWPCENVYTVLNLTSVDDSYLKSGSGTPFITKSKQFPVTLKHLQELYNQNKNTLDSETRGIKSTNSSYKNLEDLLGNNQDFPIKVHISWRITKMTTARIIRKVFPKPFFLPERSGQSVERFVMVDGAKAEPYLLPNTECSYIFMIQGSGERSIVLKPSRECGNKCRTVSVILKPSYILWYNWWYWRPISLPVTNSNGPSVTYINSYC